MKNLVILKPFLLLSEISLIARGNIYLSMPAIVGYLTQIIFLFILYFLHQFSSSPIIGALSVSLCFSITFSWFLY